MFSNRWKESHIDMSTSTRLRRNNFRVLPRTPKIECYILPLGQMIITSPKETGRLIDVWKHLTRDGKGDLQRFCRSFKNLNKDIVNLFT